MIAVLAWSRLQGERAETQLFLCVCCKKQDMTTVKNKVGSVLSDSTVKHLNLKNAWDKESRTLQI